MGGGTAASLTIAIDGEKISLTRPRRTREGETMQTISFAADSKPHAVEGGMGGMGSTSVTATWADGTLVVVQTTSIDRGGQAMTFATTEKYSLSADGKTLTVEGSRSTQQGESTWKAIYDKK
jgi:hypothetical protein